MSEAINSPEAKSRRFRPYPKYKDPGIEWLGDIPEHWEITRLKRKTSIKYGLGEPPQQDADGLPFIRATNVMRGRIVDHEMQFVDPKDVPWERDPILRTDDIIVVRSGAYTGDSAIIPPKYDGAIAGYDMVVRPTNCQARFLSWTLLSQYVLQAQIELESMRAAQPHLNAEELGSVLILDLPESEQRAISSFLDRETAKINALIEKNEKLIELLQEKRTALITQAVTKGLDPNVPMKDSGVEWLGKIPAHWDLLPLKLCVLPKSGSIKTGPFGSQLLAADMQGEDIKVYNQRTVIDRNFMEGDVFISRQKFQELKAFEIYPGDVLVTTRGTIGRCAIVPADSNQGILHPCLMRIQPDPAQLLREYIALLIQESYLVRTQLALASNATTIDVIYSDTMRQVLVPKPPLSEQVAILKRTDERVVEIYRLVEMMSEATARLKEYRTALISAAVTGKIDVRGEVAQ